MAELQPLLEFKVILYTFSYSYIVKITNVSVAILNRAMVIINPTNNNVSIMHSIVYNPKYFIVKMLQ